MTKPPTHVAWVRVKLSAEAGMTEGELVLRADRFVVEDEHVAFLVGDEVVYRMERRFFRALTWFVDRPTFGEWLRSRRKQYPNSHKPWSEVDSVRLAAAVARGVDWPEIALMLGRTASSVQRRARVIADA